MHILLTNDDGLHAPGINTLANELAKFHNVTIVAPDRERSANSHALTIQESIRCDEFPSPFENVRQLALSGTPVDCVKMGLEYFLKDNMPQLVISGINNGYNLGSDVLYSGTVAAAMEASFFSIPSIAVSMYRYESLRCFHTAEYINTLIEKVIVGEKYKGILNINVPPLGDISLENTVVVPQGVQKYENVIATKEDDQGHTVYWLAGTIDNRGATAAEDVGAIRHSVVTMTPLWWYQTDEKHLSGLTACVGNKKNNHIYKNI